MKLLIVLALLISSLSINRIYAQNSDNTPLEYRIIAISNEDNTIKSISNVVTLYYPLKIHLPTAFTPNGDGLNDTFGAVGEGIEGYKMTIFNRWGEVIFSSQNINDKWDGLHKGQPVPMGVYNYEVLAYGKEFGQVHRSGNVTVVN